MSDLLLAHSNDTVRRWHWQSTVDNHRVAITAMLAGSVEEEGILGYREPLTADEESAFCDALQHKLTSGSGQVLLGEDGAGVIGMCVVDISTMPNCRHIAEVSKTYLDPRIRKSSAVTELAYAVCRRLGELGVETLKIDVREDSPAHHVWQRFGFTTYGILDDYSRVNGMVYRGHFMTHSIGRLEQFAHERLRHANVTVEVGDVA
jgi:RimJ/RimL family protein N-acetyltransferase